MNIDSFQLKRITSDWANKKSYIPRNGEPVFISVDDTVDEIELKGVLVVGNGTDSLDKLVTSDSNRVLLNRAITESLISSKASAENPQSIGIPETALKDIKYDDKTIKYPLQTPVASPGSSAEFSRADHKHPLTRDDVWDILDVNTGPDSYAGEYSNNGFFTCRRVMFGTKAPNYNDKLQVLEAMGKIVPTDETERNLRDMGVRPGDIYIKYDINKGVD